FFHRVPLFDPDLKRVGFGVVKVNGVVVIIGVQDGKGSDQPVIYPGDKEKGIPLVYRDVERPRPIPECKDTKAGYPVTVTLPRRPSVLQVTAGLHDDKGKEVDIWTATPEKNDHPAYQRNTVALFAKTPLVAGTTYTVTVQADVDGETWKRTWNFTTAGK